jgi:hypothetical protein
MHATAIGQVTPEPVYAVDGDRMRTGMIPIPA